MVGGRRVEADEAALAHDVARGVEFLDADVVEVARAMDGRAGIRFREDEGLGFARDRLQLWRQVREALRHAAQLRLPQHPKPGAGDDPQLVLAVHVGELVFAVAEEREVIAGDPVQERTHFGRFGGIHARGRRLLHDRHHLRAHGRPILDGRAHVAQHRKNAGADRLQSRRIDLAVDLGMDQRFVAPFARRRAEGNELGVG